MVLDVLRGSDWAREIITSRYFIPKPGGADNYGGLEKEARIATRVAVSPTNKDMKLGAYRTCAYSYLIALASKNKGRRLILRFTL